MTTAHGRRAWMPAPTRRVTVFVIPCWLKASGGRREWTPVRREGRVVVRRGNAAVVKKNGHKLLLYDI